MLQTAVVCVSLIDSFLRMFASKMPTVRARSAGVTSEWAICTSDGMTLSLSNLPSPSRHTRARECYQIWSFDDA